MPTTFADVQDALHFIKANIASTQTLPSHEKSQLSAQLSELSTLLSPPEVALGKLCWGHHVLVPARIALGMGVFRAFRAKGFQACSLNELSGQVQGELALLTRIMRMLCAGGLVKEVALNTWMPLPLAIALGSDGPAAGFIDFANFQLKASAGLFDYLEKTGFKNPNNAFDGPFQYSLQTKRHFMDYLDEISDKRIRHGFDTMMGAQGAFRGQEWFEFFPIQDRLMQNVAQTDVALVDIGGNLGQDAARLHDRFPDLPGRIVVQDLPSVIRKIKPGSLPQGVESMEHDMFTPQPIQGAKMYYFRTVLHDWPDKQALQALGHIRDAMSPGSILILNDNIIPDRNAPAIMATVDYFMLDLWAAKERTEGEWNALIEEAGFQVEHVWRPTIEGMSTFAVFEASVR